MFHNDEEKSLRLQAIEESILNHLFLPINLPTSEDKDYLTQNQHENEYKLLEYIIKFFKSFDEKCILPIFPKLINCIQRWSVIQNPKNCTPSNLQLSIQQLQSCEFLPLYFHAQNAAILIEIDHDTTEQPLISSWQVLLPTDTITSSIESHLSCFPVTTYRLCDRTLLTSSIQCELLVEFMMNTIECSKSRKGVSRFDEVRDVPIAHYVCQWWISQLQGEKMKNNSDLTYQFQKKHRDHIRWKDAQQPFRRSGLWMTIKVILQLILTKDLGINGRIIYKSLIALFLTDFVSTQNLSTDLSVYCTRKITRRLNKIEFLISKTVFNEMHEWIETILSGIKIKLDKILSKFVHPQAMEISYNKNNNNESWLKLQQELNHIHTYQHLCTDLKEHLKSHQLNQLNRLSYTNPKTDLLLTDVNTIDYIPSIEVLESQYDYSTDTILTRLEIWIESNLEQWINRPASRNNEKNRFEVLLNFFEAYQNIALKHYGSEKNSTDPIGYSRFLLNSMTLIQIMHEKLCFDQRFERLKLHTLKIPNVLKLFEYLTLPNRDDMVRARHLYNFFDSFKEKIYPDIFDINQSNAFGVVFAESSESMNESLRQIHEQIKKDKQDKLEEVALAKKKYQKCIEEAGRLSCICDTYRYHRVCERCSLVNTANNIRVQIYECPLPTRREDALAVIFELQMPSEFRCYRDVVWQFINHPKPRPSHDSYYEWLKVSPHSKKLSPFYTGPPDCQVKLVSSVKSLTQSHYSTPPLITSMSADSFLCENALKVQISPNKSISFEDECCMLTPRLVHPNYRHLQFAINSTRFVQNEVIARLSECPSKMKSVQHIEFGSFRSGHHLQWWNLLSSLELDSLAFDEESVVMLIAHSLWQYGPVTSTDNLSAHAWCTESHRQILKDHFVDELIERLKHRLDDCKYNWQNEFVLFIVIIIIMRILTLCNSTREAEMTKLVMRCREIGNRWIELLTKSIQTLSTTEIDQIAVLRLKITNIALACILTFSTDSNHVHCILSTNEHVMFILKTVTTMHENISLNKNQTHKNDFMRDIMRVGGRIIVAIQPTVNKLIDKTSYQSLNEFSRMYWAVLQNDNATHIQWNKRNTNIYDGWYDGRYQEVIVSIDCLNGVFLVNGMTIGYLPHKITSHPSFIRVFENHVFEVQATGIYNTYITKQAYHGNGRIHYKFHFNESSQHLIIHEQHICSNEEYQLIPHNTFAKELPNNLASDHSHWRNTKTHDIFFRPVRFANNDFLNNISYKLFMRTGSIITQDTDQPYILINQSSTFFYTLFARYFSRLDDYPYVYMMRENALQIIASSNITSQDAIVHIYLSRLGLRFTYNGQLNAIISREYSDMCITEDQSFGTLSGLQSGLLLSAYSASTNQENKYDKCQKLIVPFGNMRPHRKVSDSYHTVTIERQASELGLRQYFIFTLNDRLRILQSTDSPMGWLYLALLHAFTSQPIPDLYTGMTGMERAFQLLNSAAKLYWNYRDSYNPTARLSEQIEAELLNDKLTEQYQTIDSSERATALAEIERCFDSDTTYKNYRLPDENINKNDINALLRLWRRNKQLRSFLFDIQRQFFGVEICQLKMLMPTSTQQFKVELYEDHYHLQLDTANTITDRNTFDQAKQKFLNSHSGNFIIPLQSTEISNPQRLFPVEVFSSIDHQINPLSDITKHFQNQLMESWNTFILTKEYRTKYPTLEEMRLFLKSIERESELFWNELERSIICSHELLFRTGLMERILPATLISIFQKIWLNEQLDESKCSSMNARMNDRKCYSLILTTEQCILLGGTIVNWIIEQQIKRALYLAHRGKREDFEKEISNVPHKNWIPSKHILWLILELEMNITIRETQIEVARHMMDPQVSNNSSTKNIVMQMNMGEGKTSVILPMLALNLSSSSSSLVRIIVLKSLFSMNHQSLRYKLGGLLNRRILPFACRRDMNFSSTQMSQIFNRFKQGLNNCDVILTSPEDILSYDLLTIDKCRRKEFDIGRLMLFMQCWSKHFVRDILDESDEILHVKYQLIYTVGGQQQIDGGIERWKTIQIVLESVRKHASDIAKNFSKEVSFEFIEHKNHFPKFHLLGNKPYPTLCEKIAEDWFSRKNYRQNERDLISNLILNSNTSIDSLINQFSHHDIQLFLTLRGLLSSEVLLVALKKRFRVNYGVNPNSSFNRLMAVPFRAKDVAAEKTEFGHIDVAIVLTQLSYYYSGLTDSQMMDCFNRLIEEERDPRLIYDEWIFQENQEQIHISIKEWKNVNLKDYYQRTCYLFPTLRYNTLVINYFLNHFVYPREAKQFPYKLISSAWDLSTADRTHRVTGFSGTNDTQLLLPVSIRQYDLPKLRKTDAIVVNNLLKPENNRYQSLPMDANTMSILTEIVNYTSLIQVILDVGALFIDQTNREVAIKWLEMSDKTKIDYAIYLESDSIIVCNRQFHHHSFLTSPASERLDRCIIYLDEIHTRGTDFKFPSGFHAAVTLGTGLTKDRFVQACMRMRRLGDGHSLSFWSSNEVHQQIRISKKRNSYAIDILRWVYQNTIHSIWDGFHHWAAQSLSYQRKVLAFQNIHWKNHQETFTNTIMEQLVQQCLEPEVIELKQMYGSPKQMQTVLDIYLFRQQQSASLPDIHQKVKDQLKTYSGSKKRLAQLLDEEQEKELEQELEEERQCETPPPVKPCVPILHEELQRLCDTNANKVNLKHLPSIFQPLSQAFVGTGFFQDCPSNGWHENLWITTEFQRVIERNGEWLDPFLRPPRWIIIYRNETMICVSAFEANWLIYHLQSNTSLATTLRLFLPRLKRHQSIFINTPTLSIPPALRLPRGNSIFNVPDNQLAELFLFNGTLYFQTMHEQNAYCAFLGLCPKPRTPFETDAFEQGWIGADGFVINSEHRSSLSILQCRFTSNPMKFVKHLVENRNNSHAPITSHVGSIIFNSTKLFSTE
ncbi:hypothetical protein I4U23_015504 [Adineta vaga]|nr:hypothetical protein I4U23_015504 [Adineta vaga]